MDQLYRSYLNKAENIYYLTDKDNLTYSQIDTLYNQLRKLRKTLLENTGDLEDYQNAENQFTDLSSTIRKTDGKPDHFIQQRFRCHHRKRPDTYFE